MIYRTNLLQGFLIIGLLAACTGSGQHDNASSETENAAVVEFKKHILTSDFISEGVAVGDINHDGRTDVMAGAYWFEAPDWTRHEIFAGKAFDGAKEYSNSFLNFSMDVNRDEWIDLVVIGYPGTLAYWYENPKGGEAHWKKHLIHESVEVGNESPAFVDVDGDGRKDILCADSKEKQIVWLKAPDAPGETAWKKFAISEKGAPATDRFSHGLGYGDLNKDGINDVIIKQGWWEGREDRTKENWTFHEASLGEDCAQMQVLDVNADGLNDVVSSSAHHYGIWWHEQVKNEDGGADWKQHEVSKAFSQSHTTSLIDINNDGNPDLIVGKRFFAHNDTDNDPGAHEPAVLMWFEFTPGTPPYFQPREIDNDSGAGLNIVTEDITGDQMADVVVSNKKGVFVFEQVE